MSITSKATRLYTALRNGAELTSKQIASRFRVANPYDVIHTLRNEGFAINLVTSTNSKGQVRRKYVMAV
jgi:hypothetical protein